MFPTTQKTNQGIPSWVWLVGAAIYVICPLDFDFLPVIGWLDDVAVSYMCIKQWNKSKHSENTPSAKSDDGGR